SEKLQPPFFEQWRYYARHAPAPAWPPPAKTDYWHREANIKPRVIYDRAYHVVSGGEKLYFGASSNDRLTCLDATTGEEIWSYFAGGPIRLAPAFYDNKIYFGADDGVVYCLDAETGELVWKFVAALTPRLIPGNERIISLHPVRTGVLIADGIAYFCAGLFPNEGVTLFALDAQTGKKRWANESLEISPQGYLLASKTRLYVPTGRTTPVVFNRENGELLGTYRGNGGTYAILKDDVLFYGGGDLGELEVREPDSKEQIASYSGTQMIVTDDVAFLRSDSVISAINRSRHANKYQQWKKVETSRRELSNQLWDIREKRKQAKSAAEIEKLDRQIEAKIDEIIAIENERSGIESGGLLWSIAVDSTRNMILTGDVLIVGSDSEINAYDHSTGRKVWSQAVQGRAYGLTAANGHLFVSTDRGIIHCFGDKKPTVAAEIHPSVNPDPFEARGDLPDFSAIVQTILQNDRQGKGYCLVLGSEEGRFAQALANLSQYNIVVIEEDETRVLAARRALDQADLYGVRVSVHQGSLRELPFTPYFANLVVSEKMLLTGDLPTSPDEIYRVLRPFGGRGFVGQPDAEQLQKIKSWLASGQSSRWTTVESSGVWCEAVRGSVTGAGEWTHLYANAQNTSCSMDKLLAPVQIQWFGRPGPHRIINRHSRPMSPLFKKGRVFIPADNRIIAVDAYNGTELWQRDIPNSRVLGALKDFGHIVLNDDYIFIAVEDQCRAFDVAAGNEAFIIKAPQCIAGEPHKWGYLANVDDILFGTGKKPDASFTILGRFNCDQLEEDFRDMILSDYLFAFDWRNKELLWTYRNGVVFNNTITVGDGFIYFIESRNARAVSDEDGRLRVDTFCDGETYLVKLDQRSGTKIWEKPFSFPFEQIMYLAFAQQTLLVTGSFNRGDHVHYALYAFDAESGEQSWTNTFRGGDTRWNNEQDKKTINGSHGEQWQHPVIMGDHVILPPYDFDLHTGKQGRYVIYRGGHGCGGLSACERYLFARGGNPRLYPLHDGRESGTPLTRVNRPGCWINTIPVGGLILLPESSSGCTCDYPIQTSFAFVPKQLQN
ncbi:PQQ-binding-like beta-propeller repeat protein, partial [candidate division KSB1 bacterium]|nr:PQQ-binding-like beta-propeller repeat protein [candidate division KSB1 bacterium]